MNKITSNFNFLSQKRLDKYKLNSNESNDIALARHFYNSKLAESFYSSINYFEIMFRNKIDFIFSKQYGEDWIFNSQFILGENKTHYLRARERMIKANKEMKNKNHIVSELNFAFWTYLFSKKYHEKVWNNFPYLLNEIFNCYRFTININQISKEVNRIRIYRNYVSHYGAILMIEKKLERPEKIHNLIYRLIKDMEGSSILKKLKKIDNFNSIFKLGQKNGFIRK